MTGDQVLWFIGLVVVCVAAGFLLWLWAELFVVGLANSISFHRFLWCNRIEPWTLRHWLWAVPRSVVAYAVCDFWGYRNNGSTSINLQNGAWWCGIGDWTRGGMHIADKDAGND